MLFWTFKCVAEEDELFFKYFYIYLLLPVQERGDVASALKCFIAFCLVFTPPDDPIRENSLLWGL